MGFGVKVNYGFYIISLIHIILSILVKNSHLEVDTGSDFYAVPMSKVNLGLALISAFIGFQYLRFGSSFHYKWPGYLVLVLFAINLGLMVSHTDSTMVDDKTFLLHLLIFNAALFFFILGLVINFFLLLLSRNKKKRN